MIPKILIFIIASFIVYGCAVSNKMGADEYVGEWEYVVSDLPDGDETGILLITKIEGIYNGLVQSSDGDFKINDFKIEAGSLSGNYNDAGYTVEVSGKFESDTFNGKLMTEGSEFPVSAIKKP